MRALGLGLVAALAALALATTAGGANECDGLPVCVSVPGPWVVVPTGGGTRRPSVEYQVTCPKNHVAGGLDARLSAPGIDVAFLGTLGSPVNPGITTARSVVFVAKYVRSGARAPTFRPFVGCLPGSGGGSRVPTALTVVRPGHPVVRRVRTVRVRPGRATLVGRCVGRERLVGFGHAVGFFTKAPPAADLAQSVRATSAAAGGRVLVQVDVDAEVAGVRAVVQVQAECARRGR